MISGFTHQGVDLLKTQYVGESFLGLFGMHSQSRNHQKFR